MRGEVFYESNMEDDIEKSRYYLPVDHIVCAVLRTDLYYEGDGEYPAV